MHTQVIEISQLGDLYGRFITRLSHLHGTELATQLAEELSAQKRAKGAPPPLAADAKHEALRAVKKRRKMALKQEVVDLVAIPTPTDNPPPTLPDNPPPTTVTDTQYSLGENVTAIEGVMQLEGTVVEIDVEDGCYVICCSGVDGYPNGYNMMVPFTQSTDRINIPSVTKRKRRKKNIFDNS